MIIMTISHAEAITVSPEDMSARFRDMDSYIKINSSCRDYDYETVNTDNYCNLLFTDLEISTVIPVSFNTIMKNRIYDDIIFSIIEKTIKKNNHAALHYLIGFNLSTGQLIKPDYKRAVHHLSIAADRKNAAAADLLGSLLLKGKGVARDIRRAISLYEYAAANGYPNAALNLAKIYYTGKYVDKNKNLAISWLKAAENINFEPAKNFLELIQLDTITNAYHIIPDQDPGKVKIARYGAIDAPDIPPAFGFTPNFQEIDDKPHDLETLDWLMNNIKELPTPYIYALVTRIAANDTNKAWEYYFLARLRLIYDLSRCSDNSANEALHAWNIYLGKSIPFLFKSYQLTTEQKKLALTRAIILESEFPGDREPWWVCRAGIDNYLGGIDTKFGPLKLKPKSEWPKIRKSVIEQSRKSMDNLK